MTVRRLVGAVLLFTFALVMYSQRDGDAQTQLPKPTDSNSRSANQPRFEVASVRLNVSDPPGMSIQSLPGGNFSARNVPLRNLIRRAYRLQISQIEGGPQWLDTARFNIEARSGRDLPFDSPELMLMLRNLLIDRFKVRVHSEVREKNFYALTLSRADGRLGGGLRKSTIDCEAILARGPLRPQNQPSPQVGRPNGAPSSPDCSLRVGGDLGGAMTTRVNGVTIAKLAEYLQPDADRLIVDKTGLTGTFDVEMTYSVSRIIGGQPLDPRADLGGPPLAAALPPQLGLKLDPQRGPVEVLVVDSAEMPSEN